MGVDMRLGRLRLRLRLSIILLAVPVLLCGCFAPQDTPEQPKLDDNRYAFYKDTSDVPCPTGTNDVAVVETFYVPVSILMKYKIRLCELPNVPDTSGVSPAPGVKSTGHALVSSPIAEVWFAFAEAAKQAGHPITATASFRPPDWQTSHGGKPPPNDGDCGSPAVPAEGCSSHGTGLAIDVYGFGAGEKYRPAQANEAMWNWMRENSRKYGLGMSNSEANHFDRDFYFSNPSNSIHH